jgi:cytochrome oxidase Cu insertion factor (SCO1/SenC/PrrC family)
MRVEEPAPTPAPNERRRAALRWVRWRVAVAALATLVALQDGGRPATGAPGIARVGSPAPDFTLKLFNGKTVTLSGLKGKPVVLNFWHSG